MVFGLKDSAGAVVSGSVAYDSATNSAAFTPGSALAYSTVYTATVSGATNASGQAMAAPYSWTFTTVAAPLPPTVASVSPANRASGVGVSVKPAVTFNQAVTGSSVVFGLKDSAGAVVSGSVAYDSATNSAAFTPGSALAYSTVYTATVSGATNASGQAMAAPYSWTFTTVAAPLPPTVASVSPANNASGVGVSVKPAVTFNQAVTGSSVVFGLKDSAGAVVAGSVAYDSATNSAAFTPGSALAYSTVYTATVSGATNASGQAMAAPYSWTFTTVAAPACPCSVFSATSVPVTASSNDSLAVELGMKFRADVAGTVTGVRFYKGSANTGIHTGHLWSGAGALLATVTFSGESSSGWQQATFSSPVPIAADTTYVVSYYAPNGSYAANSGYFNSAANNGPLHGLASGTDGPNGVYRYGTSTGFPTDSFNNTNYWVDAIFSAGAVNTTPTVASVSPANNASGVGVSVKPAVTFNQAVTGSSVVFGLKDSAGAVVSGSVAYDSATNSAAFTPGSALAYSTVYTATVSGATNASGQAMAAPYSWTFTTVAAPACPCSVFSATSVPVTASSNDSLAVELGMKFRADVAGTVTGVRFYKGSANTGIHTGHLWSGAGALLATVTFSGESSSGWQQATFSSPVPIAADTTYVVSYYAPNGSYAANSGYFNSAANNGPLHGLASGTDGPNGVYRYGTSTGFPTDSFNNTNYWVDAIFSAGAVNTTPTVASVSPANNASGVGVSVKPAVTFNQAVTGSSVVFGLKDSAGAVVAGSVAYDSATNSAAFTPGSALAYSTVYTATVSGATNASGQAMAAPYSWTFTTVAAPACPCSVFSATSVPVTASSNDSLAVELGMKFRADVAGTVTGVRFYKGSANTGIHTGHLWSGAGALLATVTFSGESSSGWQQATFSSPVPIAADTTYVVSYYAPNGSYAANSGYFNSAANNGPLHGLASGTDGPNGVYRYGTSTGFPTDSFNNTNYWVDAIFSAG